MRYPEPEALTEQDKQHYLNMAILLGMNAKHIVVSEKSEMYYYNDLMLPRDQAAVSVKMSDRNMAMYGFHGFVSRGHLAKAWLEVEGFL